MTEKKKHARNSPSGASGWMRCADWVSDPTGSKFADWGTAAHDLAERCLKDGTDAAQHLGLSIEVNGVGHEVDRDMATCVQAYLDTCRGIPGHMLVEQRLSIEHITGEEGAAGTVDCAILAEPEMVIIDLKSGKGVEVSAENNEQLMIYALAALPMAQLIIDVERVRLIIVQPRIHNISEWTISIDDLLAFGKTVKRADVVQPGEKQCRWCSRKPTCTALRTHVERTMFDCSPDAMTPDELLSTAMQQADLVESWIKSVRAEVEKRLLSGQPVDGFKLVQGKRGRRNWINEADALSALRAAGLKDDTLLEWTLISPTLTETLVKDKLLSPGQWKDMQQLIEQKEGAPSVAPVSDKRPALQRVAFENLEDATTT